ncbi:YhcN/YlaJ family sporulation lipoprotein [Bacillus marinisedimentorum]|uniref:YhcN/YlaJ family sporulation lipoprotein n=1 Tax=Bacillus marinisedimentorum TaxID=1821260 RepID=UPI0007E171A7|nr:YhcN/YlaJ family sporulation lipoprotein [Bacillus marinisedimentorum]
MGFKRHTALLFTAAILVTSGCAQTQAENENEADRAELIKVKQSDETQTEDKTSQEIAEHLVNLASSVPNVNDATAVVAGPYAVVGIDVNSELDRSRVGTIKYSVSESLENDPYGKDAVVIADADTVSRLREIAREIRQGQPVGGVVEELAAIVGRIMPQVPEQPETDNADPTDENDQQLSEKEQRELQQQQNRESNRNIEKGSE